MEIKNVIWADAKWDVCYFKFIDNKLRSVVFETSNQQLSDSEVPAGKGDYFKELLNNEDLAKLVVEIR